MLSWPAPLLPTLPGTGPVLKVHDTARGEVVATSPGPTARMYVCGITPYDATHLGHAATYLAFDLVNRMWRDAGHDVHYVQNVTDIDDPLLERADRDGEDWIVLAMRETALFREDMTALRVLPPEDYVGAVESIPRIVAHIETLLDAGLAYVLDDGTGDVYHDVAQAPGFGGGVRLRRGDDAAASSPSAGETPTGRASGSRWTRCCGAASGPASRPGPARGAPRAGPAGTSSARPSRWTPSAWASTCRAAAATWSSRTTSAPPPTPRRSPATKPFARAYVHAAMIGLDGEKMSKSRGNLVFVSRLRGDGVDPMAIRLALLSGHYRTDRAWTADLLQRRRGAAGHLAARGRRLRRRARPAAPVLAGLRERLADDLDSPGAIALVDALGGADPRRRRADARGRGAAHRLRRRRRPARCALQGLRMTAHNRPFRFTDRAAREAAEEQLAPAATRAVGHPRAGPGPEPEDPLRTAFERDRDRILHAKAFRRLKHKTQVFLNPDGDHFVTRLTHTLQVTQVARSLARALGLNETLAEAIALAHDVGHSPFGHLGEDALEPYVAGGWHHAAQGVRIVEVLEHLNLTWEVRDGVRAHSWKIDPPPATREGECVRYADRIGYLSHDALDAIRAGVLRLGRPAGPGPRGLRRAGQRDGRHDDRRRRPGQPRARQHRRRRRHGARAARGDARAARLHVRARLQLARPPPGRSTWPSTSSAGWSTTTWRTPSSSRPRYRDTEADAVTQVVDYVSGMTDRFALAMHDRLFDADARPA